MPQKGHSSKLINDDGTDLWTRRRLMKLLWRIALGVIRTGNMSNVSDEHRRKVGRAEKENGETIANTLDEF